MNISINMCRKQDYAHFYELIFLNNKKKMNNQHMHELMFISSLRRTVKMNNILIIIFVIGRKFRTEAEKQVSVFTPGAQEVINISKHIVT